MGCLTKIIITILIVFIVFFVFLNSHWFQRLFYPIPHFEHVQEESGKYNMDPYLSWHNEVESKFNENANLVED